MDAKERGVLEKLLDRKVNGLDRGVAEEVSLQAADDPETCRAVGNAYLLGVATGILGSSRAGRRIARKQDATLEPEDVLSYMTETETMTDEDSQELLQMVARREQAVAAAVGAEGAGHGATAGRERGTEGDAAEEGHVAVSAEDGADGEHVSDAASDDEAEGDGADEEAADGAGDEEGDSDREGDGDEESEAEPATQQ